MGNSMANTIGTRIGNAAASKVKEAQHEMMEEQKKNMIQNAERQRKTMMAMKIANTREILNWTTPLWAIVFTISLFYPKNASKEIPAYFAALIPAGVVIIYQTDLVYGDKAERIERYYQETLKEKFGITPPSEPQQDKFTELWKAYKTRK
jgi:hypothetical protein